MKRGLEKLIATTPVSSFVATYGVRGGIHFVKVKFQR
jgi:hypothetical protein